MSFIALYALFFLLVKTKNTNNLYAQFWKDMTSTPIHTYNTQAQS